MTTLKEETIRGIQAEGAFNMEYFGSFEKILKFTKRIFGTKSCGTPVCMAGHIVAAQRRLGRKIEAVKDWGDTVTRAKSIGLRVEFLPVPMAARFAWARSYGVQEANRLEFDTGGWGDALEEVTAEEAVAHLNGADPVLHDDE